MVNLVQIKPVLKWLLSVIYAVLLLTNASFAQSIRITSPAANTNIVANATLTIRVSITGVNTADILQVDYWFDNFNYIGSGSTSPYSLTTPASLSAGSHIIRARLHLRNGNTFDAANVTFNITASITQSSTNNLTAPIGMNIAGSADYGDFMFLNIIKQARQWNNDYDPNQGGLPSLDANGWIRSIGNNGAYLYFGSVDYEAGDYVLKWNGVGNVDIHDRDYVYYPITTVGSNRKICRLPGNKEFLITVSNTGGTNYVKDIVLCKIRNEAKITAGEIWDDEYFAHFNMFSLFRFMDLMCTNENTSTTWGQRTRPTNYTQYTHKGICVEYLVMLANKYNVNPWFCMPTQANDSYIRSFATYVRDNLNPNLKVYIEYSNEVWNWNFPQNTYAYDRAVALNIGNGEDDWVRVGRFYNFRSRQVMVLWENIFGGTSRLQRVSAWQAGKDNNWLEIVLGAPYNSFQKIDHWAVGPYIGNEISSEAEYDDNLNFIRLTQPVSTVDDIFRWLNTRSIPNMISSTTLTATSLKNDTRFRNINLIAYEAGQHMIPAVLDKDENGNTIVSSKTCSYREEPVGSGNYVPNDPTCPARMEAMNQLMLRANRDSRMYDVYTTYLNAWKNAGGKLLTAFSSTGQGNIWGYWGHIENPRMSTSSAYSTYPKYRALRDFSAKGRWWTGGPFREEAKNTTIATYENDILAYPNPTINKQLNLVLDNTIPSNVAIYSMAGNLVYSSEGLVNTTTHDLTNLAQGLYILKVTGGVSKSIKISVE